MMLEGFGAAQAFVERAGEQRLQRARNCLAAGSCRASLSQKMVASANSLPSRSMAINVHERYDVDRTRRGWDRCRGLRPDEWEPDERNLCSHSSRLVAGDVPRKRSVLSSLHPYER